MGRRSRIAPFSLFRGQENGAFCCVLTILTLNGVVSNLVHEVRWWSLFSTMLNLRGQSFGGNQRKKLGLAWESGS